MCEKKTVLIVAVLLLAAAGVYTYQINPKLGQHSEIKSESPCEKAQKILFERGRMLLSS